MKITKWIDIQREIEIEIGAADISAIFRDGSEEDARIALLCINDYASLLTGMPTEIIEQFNQSQIREISRYFKEQAERFEQYLKPTDR